MAITIQVTSICLCEATGKYEVTSSIQGAVPAKDYGYTAQDGPESASTEWFQLGQPIPATVELTTVNVGDTVNVEVWDWNTRQVLATANKVYNGEVCSLCNSSGQ